MEPRRSFRLERGSSIRLGRSYRSALIPESVTSECARITSYERLSESMRLSCEYNSRISTTRNKNKTLGILSKVFSFRKTSGHDIETEKGAEIVAEEEKVKKETNMKKKKKKKWSSWLPDQDKRWPVQGW